jgi:proline racemase
MPTSECSLCYPQLSFVSAGDGVGHTITFQAIYQGSPAIGRDRVCLECPVSLATVIPTIDGRSWLAGLIQCVYNPSNPFPEGFRLDD